MNKNAKKSKLSIRQFEKLYSDNETFIKNRIHELEKQLLFTKADAQNKQQLLPLTTGGLSLIMISGAVDGLVEAGENSHVIKGTIRKNISRRAKQSCNTTLTEVIEDNVIQLEMLTGDGNFTTLV